MFKMLTEVHVLQGKGLIVCGDDKGSLWLYNMPSMVNVNPDPIKKVIDPTTRLMWPELQVGFSSNLTHQRIKNG